MIDLEDTVRNLINVTTIITIAGKLGADAQPYQEKIVKSAVEESRK